MSLVRGLGLILLDWSTLLLLLDLLLDEYQLCEAGCRPELGADSLVKLILLLLSVLVF